jgi:hypothetical protein
MCHSQPWTTNGARITPDVAYEYDQALCSFSDGSTLVVWRDSRDGRARVYASVLSASGDTLPAWPSNGLSLSPPNTDAFTPAVVQTSDTTAFVAWHDQRFGRAQTFCQMVEAHRGIRSGWPRFGAAACPTYGWQTLVGVCKGANSTAYVLVRDTTLAGASVLHVLGSVDADSAAITISTRPIPVPLTATSAGICSDGLGGAFVMYWPIVNPVVDHLFAQHVLATDEVDTLWPASGREAASFASTKLLLAASNDGAGGLVLSWMDDRDADSRMFLNRITSAGQFAAGWPAAGLPLSLSAGYLIEDHASLAAPDSEHIYVGCRRSDGSTLGDLFVQRLTSNGTTGAGWPVAGVELTTGGGANNFTYDLTVDGEHGCFVVWSEIASGSGSKEDIFATRLGEMGSPVAPWPASGVVVCNDPARQLSPSLTRSADGGLVTAWRDSRGGSSSVLYAARVTLDASVPTRGFEPRTTLSGKIARVEWFGDASALDEPRALLSSFVAGGWRDSLLAVTVERGRAWLLAPKVGGASAARCTLFETPASGAVPHEVGVAAWEWPGASQPEPLAVAGSVADAVRVVSLSGAPGGSAVSWRLYDVGGREIRRSVRPIVLGDSRSFTIDVSEVRASGTYFLAVSAARFGTAVARLVVAR